MSSPPGPSGLCGARACNRGRLSSWPAVPTLGFVFTTLWQNQKSQVIKSCSKTTYIQFKGLSSLYAVILLHLLMLQCPGEQLCNLYKVLFLNTGGTPMASETRQLEPAPRTAAALGWAPAPSHRSPFLFLSHPSSPQAVGKCWLWLPASSCLSPAKGWQPPRMQPLKPSLVLGAGPCPGALALQVAPAVQRLVSAPSIPGSDPTAWGREALPGIPWGGAGSEAHLPRSWGKKHLQSPH